MVPLIEELVQIARTQAVFVIPKRYRGNGYIQTGSQFYFTAENTKDSIKFTLEFPKGSKPSRINPIFNEEEPIEEETQEDEIDA